MLRAEPRQRCLTRRCSKKRCRVADKQIGLIVDCAKRAEPLAGRAREAIGGAVGANLESRIHDWSISGAAAQVARQRVVDLRSISHTVAFMKVSEQAHHDARSAEAALRAVLARHRGLNRMQFAVLGEVFDRNEFGAVQLAEQRDARIDRLVHDAAVALARHDHGAGATIAFRAAFFSPGRTLLQTQPVEHCATRLKAVERNSAAPPEKLQIVSCHAFYWIRNIGSLGISDNRGLRRKDYART